MNRSLIIAALLLAAGTGYWLGTRGAGTIEPGAGAQAPAERKILYWVAPMDPNYRRDQPGKSPMGMDLVPVYADEQASGDGVHISPAMENNLGVRVATVQRRPLWRRVEATGYVGYDETLISHIHLRTEGWINRLTVNAEGERVKRGDLLFELYSPELLNAQKEYLQAAARSDARLLQGADAKLLALGMVRADIDALRASGQATQTIRVLAPQDGIVTQLTVREGMFVQPNTTVLTLADLSRVWLLADVFESQAGWVARDQAAEARLEYLPGTIFSGEVDYVYPVLDPDTRTLRVRLTFDNPAERLKPNMYARVSIYGTLRPQALSIPREALIRGPQRDRVVVSLGAGRFTAREVMTGMESGDWVEVLAGLAEGEEVVTSAQFLLDSEASLAGSIERLDAVPETDDAVVPVTAFGSGWVESVDPAARRLRISHGPIDELGWPGMTMEFEVGAGAEVDLAALQAGQDIRFQLQQVESGRFVVIAIGSRDADDQALTPELLESLERAERPLPEKVVRGEGIVVWARPGTGQLRLEHGPIPALEWPAMTMEFRVREGLELPAFEAGTPVRFGLERDGDAWVVSFVEAVPAAAPAEHHHD